MPRVRTGWVALLGGYVVLQVLGHRAGATRAERRAALPGDTVVPCPQLVTDHAATIAAPPRDVWPWLTQMGWHRGGWYTPGWVDRLFFPANRPSLDVLDPGLVRELEVGDTIPDGPPGSAEYVVVDVRAPEHLVLRSTTHVPPGWAEHGAAIEWTWSFRLTPLPAAAGAPGPAPTGTRLHVRVRGRMRPWWFAAAYLAAVPADLVMATGMLRGIRRRAEGPGQPRPPSPLT